MCFLSFILNVIKKLTGSNLRSRPFVQPKKTCFSDPLLNLSPTAIAHLICSPSKSEICACFYKVYKFRTCTLRSGASVKSTYCLFSYTWSLLITKLKCQGIVWLQLIQTIFLNSSPLFRIISFAIVQYLKFVER